MLFLAARIYPPLAAWYNPFMSSSPVIRGLPLFLIAGALFLAGYGLMNFSKTSIDIEWETATELDTIGFNIYRADSLNGNLLKVNDTLIPASSDSLSGGKYAFVDRSAQPGVTYYYYLEDVDANGVTNLNGPTVVKATNLGLWLLLVSFILFLIGGYGLLVFTLPAIRQKAISS